MPALDRPAPSTRSVGRTAPPTAAVHRHNGRTKSVRGPGFYFFSEKTRPRTDRAARTGQAGGSSLSAAGLA